MARMLPLWDTAPHRRAPVLTALLIAACLGAFGYEVSLMFAGEKGFEAWITTHALVPARWLAGVADPAQWATVATSMFLHGGVAHVLGNCWFLWVFGNNVEDRLGFLGFGFLYVVSGLVAALTQVATDLGSQAPMVGASGAISGVLGAYLIFSRVPGCLPWCLGSCPCCRCRQRCFSCSGLRCRPTPEWVRCWRSQPARAGWRGGRMPAAF